MAVYEIPTDTFRNLLINIDGEISPASPFAPLLTDEVSGDLEPLLPWLEEHDLLDSPAKQNGKVALLPSLRRSLDVVARPIRGIIVSEIGLESSQRAAYVTDGIDVSIAMLDPNNCRISDPVDLEAFRDDVLIGIGSGGKQSKKNPGYRLHPIVLTILGSLQGPWGDDGNEDAPEPIFQALTWPISRLECEVRLKELLGEDADMEEILGGMIEDNILESENSTLNIHPEFAPWYDRINSGHFLEIQRLEIPDSDISRLSSAVRAVLVGPKDDRVVMWPADDDTGDVLIFKPTAEELLSFVNFLVGWADIEEEE